MTKVLVTGAAGFIGYHLTKQLMQNKNYEIIGIDNINDYYDIDLKMARLNDIGILKNDISWGQYLTSSEMPNYRFVRIDIENNIDLTNLFENEKFDVVVNLAAQAGVRYSLKNPRAYIQSNINGFFNVLEACRNYNIKHLIYASSSSVYGLNKHMPFSVTQKVDHPASLYAATKKSNELMAHTYSHLYNLPTTGLRFFTVYGTHGRPDMAYFSFTESILSNIPIDVYNNGKMKRDFTHVSDIVNCIQLFLKKSPPGINNTLKNEADLHEADLPTTLYQIFNVGNNTPILLLDFIKILEDALGKKAKLNFLPMQSGDVVSTWADIEATKDYVGYYPKKNILDGLNEFVTWYLKFKKI